MKINVQELINRKNDFKKVEFSEIISEYNESEPIIATMKIDVFDNFIKVQGKGIAVINSICDRCLKPFKLNLEFEIDETYSMTNEVKEYKKTTELKNDDFVTYLNGANEIDLTDLIYQSVTLYLPNKLVCDINCIGDEKINKYISNIDYESLM